MKPIDQTRLHDLENGQAGNCMTAFIASVLEMPIEQVPLLRRGLAGWTSLSSARE